MRCAARLSLLPQALRILREPKPLKRGTPAKGATAVWEHKPLKRGTPVRCGALVWIGLSLVLGAGRAWGGGPVGVTTDARPLRWDAGQAVRYQVDAGGLGSRGSETATGMVQRAFQTWGEVPSARLRIEFAGRLAQDVTGRNAAAFLDNLPLTAPGVVLFDHDGSIVDSLFGYGASEGLLGFAEPYEDPRQPGRIVQSVAVINGPLHDEFRDPYLLSTIVHEMGHFLGLDHSQINGEQQYDGDPTNDGICPVMSYFRGPNDTGGLHHDDRAWFSWLYPAPDHARATGTIRGRVMLPDGATGLTGINVIARRSDSPQVIAASCVSGYLAAGDWDGSPDPSRLGEFLIPGLPPGEYTLELASLDGQTPHRMRDGYLVGGRQYWREGASTQDSSEARSPIRVQAGQEVNGIDFVVRGEDIGEARVQGEQEPNSLPTGQPVALPALITGMVETGPGPARLPLEDEDLTSELTDVYRVIVREPTIVTAVLSTVTPGADLDLYLVALDGAVPYTVTASLALTPLDSIQYRLPAGRYYFGVHRAGSRGSTYTLRLLSTPAPDPERAPEPAFLAYLVVGDVTPTSAVARWYTTLPIPSVLQYDLPLREAGSTQQVREHRLALDGLRAGTAGNAEAYAASEAGVDGSAAPYRTANPPAAGGAPRITVARRSSSLYANQVAEVELRFFNTGAGDARRVWIDQMVVSPGWRLLLEEFTGAPFPLRFEVGSIGAGGSGALVLRLIRTGGDGGGLPTVTVSGTYLDAAGQVYRF